MTEPWDENVSLAWLQSFPIYRYRRMFIERNLARWEHPRRILEAGSGPAHDSLIFAGRGSQVTAIDVSFSAVRGAQRIYAGQHLSIQVSCGNLLQLPFAENWFDLTWNAGTLEHFERDEDVVQALVEMVRVTRPGGTVLVLVPNRYYFWYQWYLRRLKQKQVDRQYEFERSFSPSQLSKLFTSIGLSQIRASGDHIHPSPEFLLPFTGRLTAALRWVFAPLEKNGDGTWKALLGLDTAVWGRKS